ncbi:MAG: pyrroline-5-carboxylate reductase [Coriobacteriales bacterium]|nr:pyrroline-5-carboxylate reductase [Coriobacteriales bacterium]
MASDLFQRLGRLLIVGGGKMGEGILAGLLALPNAPRDAIVVANPGVAKRIHLQETYGVACVADAAQALPADTVILAVKPQVLPTVLQGLSQEAALAGSLVISVAAGVTTERLESLLPISCPVVRVMPNLPLVCGQGMCSVSAGSRCSDAQAQLVLDLFSRMGDAVLIPEEQQDASCALHGRGPAYVALVLDELARAGEKAGLEPDAAARLALQTMLGTATLLKESGMSPQVLMDKVSSPGGTTIAALQAMRAADLPQAIERGVEAAINRSKELAGS